MSATVYITNFAGSFTRDYDKLRTGANLSESVLTPANVNSTQFGKLFSYALDGVANASPLYVANVNIPGQGFHNVIYVATEHDSVYAFDADGLSPNPLWKVSFINPAGGITTFSPSGDAGDCCPSDMVGEAGITGTPVIDPSTGTLYVSAETKEVSGATTNFVHRLHALDITSGAEKVGGPVVIQATIPGQGDGSSGGQLPFSPLHQNQRAALLLNNGVVYIAWAAHADQPPYHGWIMGYDASTLKQVMVYCSTPNGGQGGIWQSGDGLATDSTGRIYFVTGNGGFNVDQGGTGTEIPLQRSIPTVLSQTTSRPMIRRTSPLLILISDEVARYFSRTNLVPSSRGHQRRKEWHHLPSRPRQHGPLQSQQ